ncbi:MAG: hypothetical protein ACT4NY_10340, partial [Pseudonocardiales bacterium]
HLYERVAREVSEAVGVKYRVHVDSLVRQSAELITLDRREVEELRMENKRLHQQRGDDLVAAARAAAHDKRVGGDSTVRQALCLLRPDRR